MPASKKTLPIKGIIRAYNKGASLKQLGDEHGTDPRTIRARLVEAGVLIRPS